MLKYKDLIISLLLLSITSCVKNGNKADSETTNESVNNGIQVGHFDSIYSQILDQKRELVIYLPESVKDPNRKREKYPVVYLLDGDDSFVPFVGMLKLYSEMNDTKILPEMIVVGIPNIDFRSRMMDFSPTTEDNQEQYGGGDRFLEFIQKELFPYIEQKYSGSQNRTIVGHSFGGLVVLNALTHHSDMFVNYLMIDGSLWFDNELFLKNPEYSLEGQDLEGKNLYIGIANTATYGSSLEDILIDTIGANQYIRHSMNLINQIEKLDTRLNMAWKYYDNDTHGSSAFLSQMDGFRFFYSWFEFKSDYKFRTKYFVPETAENRFANLTKSHFDVVSKKLGYSFFPDREWLSESAYMLLNRHKQTNQAKEVYELNMEYYPKDPQVYKDLGDFYLSQEDTLSAKEYYKKAINLGDNSDVQELLIKLGI